MAFEVFTRKVQYGGIPSITFTTNGRFAFNKAATAYFEKNAIEFVLLMWDAEKKLIGVKPISKKDSRSYKIRMGVKGNGCGFSAMTFLKHIGYDVSKTSSIPVKWIEDEGIFVIEVPEEFLTDKKEDSVLADAT